MQKSSPIKYKVAIIIITDRKGRCKINMQQLCIEFSSPSVDYITYTNNVGCCPGKALERIENITRLYAIISIGSNNSGYE